MKQIKCVLVGDDNHDKTQLLISYSTNLFPGQYIPTVFDDFKCNINVKDQEVELHLHDTSGSQDYAKLRPLSYPQTDVFLFVFSLLDPTSFENIEKVWVPEVREHCPNTRYILIGTKRNERNLLLQQEDANQSDGSTPIPFEKGEEMKNKIMADDYIECDALQIENVKKVFTRAAEVALNIQKEEDDKK